MAEMEWDRIIIGIDPGTNVMGYGILGIKHSKPSVIAMGVLMLSKFDDHYMRLRRISERVTSLIDQYLPDEMAIEAPFFGKNVQSMLKLGRSQGVAIAAAVGHSVPVHEYAPMKIKMAITGQGQASKEQVAAMLQRLLRIEADEMPKLMDATDALGVAYCHFMQQGNPVSDTHYSGWKDFINKNQDKISRIGH